MKSRGHIVTFGESLLRLSPPDHLRWEQTRVYESFFGGAEANVAISLARLGLPLQHVTRLPDNDLGAACRQSLRQHGVGLDFIQIGGERLGIYFLEAGSGSRPSRVIYDRAGSAFATLAEDTMPWPDIFSQAGWFHWSGINPGLSAAVSQATAKAIDAARAAGLIVSCDLNYRHSLWQWGAAPAAIMPDLIRRCDVLSANTAYLMLGLPKLPVGRNPDEAAEACARLSAIYPNLKQIAMTCRDDKPDGGQAFAAVLWHDGRVYTSRAYAIRNVVDRVGAGDAFMAGLVYGLLSFPDAPQRIIDFAAACAVIKTSIKGDANIAGIGEIEQLLMTGNGFDIIR